MSIRHKFPKLDDYVSKFIQIPAGEFHLGASPVNDYNGLLTTMPTFSMGMTPVTIEMYTEYCKAAGISNATGNFGEYVVRVSWDEIMNPAGFCAWASDVVGMQVTLPTNAQWEYAYRSGSDGLNYPWGNDFADGVNFTNSYGLSDMHGVVWQWCLDGPSEPTYSERRWIRGAAECWDLDISIDNPYVESIGDPNNVNYELFRCCAKVHEFQGYNQHIGFDYSDQHIGFRLCTHIS